MGSGQLSIHIYTHIHNINVQKHAKRVKIQMEKRKTTTSKTQSSDKKLKSEVRIKHFVLVCLMLGNRPGAIKAKAAARKNYRM